MQVNVNKNIYFQQHGDTVHGVYVNKSFVSIKVGDKELDEKELSTLASQMYEICKNTESIQKVIAVFEKEYETNPNRDGVIIALSDNCKYDLD